MATDTIDLPAQGEAEVWRLQGMLVYAIATGTELKFVYGFKEPATVQDLAKLEKAINGWFRATCRTSFKLKSAEIPKISFDLTAATWLDDGDNTVTIRLDMGLILPGERPAELLAMAREMMNRLDAAAGVAHPSTGESA